jgi:hypothetical protein
MDKNRFKGILNEFLLKFDGLEVLIKELRDILFPYREGLFTRTYRDPDKLYRPIIDAFDRAIAKYIKGELDEKV